MLVPYYRYNMDEQTRKNIVNVIIRRFVISFHKAERSSNVSRV